MENELRIAKKNSKPFFMAPHIPKYYYGKYRTWLDCASGDGFMVADYFLNRIPPEKYYCIDQNNEKLKRLEDIGCNIFCKDLEVTDIKDFMKNVSMILCIETIEHLEKDTAIRLFDDFISILENKGMICLSFPIVVPLDNPINKHQPDIKHYIEYYKHFNSFTHQIFKKSHFLFFEGKNV